MTVVLTVGPDVRYRSRQIMLGILKKIQLVLRSLAGGEVARATATSPSCSLAASYSMKVNRKMAENLGCSTASAPPPGSCSPTRKLAFEAHGKSLRAPDLRA